MPIIALIGKNRLDPDDRAQLRDLQDICEAADGYRVKFNWEMMADRPPGGVNDFCFYDNGRLVGYAPLDGFGALYEITAAVLPAFRGRGIFRQILAAARVEAERRRARQILLVAYRSSSDRPARLVRCARRTACLNTAWRRGSRKGRPRRKQILRW